MLSCSSTRAFSLNMSKTSRSSVSVLAPVQEKLENSWVRQLCPETRENLVKSRRVSGLDVENDDNRTKRPVYNGHYVLVKPTPLRQPRLVLYSPDVATMLLNLSHDQIHSQEFVDWVSGNLVMEETWATGYALSIMGTRYTSNCPYGTGDGYGDGRAISIAEFGGYELQLKGAGKTPYARGADGRAVLRSSIREFLASEAMHYLGVRTTRALSLVVSDIDQVQRPWYSETRLQIPSMDDPRLFKYSEEDKKKLIAQLRNEKADPNRMITEACAITCRVSPSFVRIGHIDLFARRALQASSMNNNNVDTTTTNYSLYDTSTNEWNELEKIVWHACFREYRNEAYDPFIDSGDIAGAASAFLDHAANRLSTMVAHWVRVGFAQGNFNADNCLVGGHTMDYGM
jgi:serine/tyrosine/threonine adenylyltransferase